MLKLKVSGSFKTQPGTDKDRCNFSNVEVIIPENKWEYHTSHAQRMFPLALEKDKRYKDKNYEGLIKIYVDNVEEIEGDIICLHKNIKEMSWAELQSLACHKKLREIPLYKSGNLRTAREKAYIVYTEQINKRRVFKQVKDIKKFKEQMVEDRYSDPEIEKLVSEALSLIVDPENPKESYNFANLPSLYVDGILEDKKESK